jgi:hypothetical protein
MLRRKQVPNTFTKEIDLCAAFIAAVGNDWVPYAETAGWDILLVRKADGFQIGIEAKLRLNAEVLSQAIEDGHSYSVTNAGPDCRAVLVPHNGAGAFDKIAAYIGVTVIKMSAGNPSYRERDSFRPELPRIGNDGYWCQDWHELVPDHRHKLPDYIPDVAAGASAPIKLTDWKIRAIKIVVTLEKRGFVTRKDFKHCQIDHRRWIERDGWLRLEGAPPCKWVLGSRMPDFKAQHPRVYAEIEATADKWMLTVL